MQMIFYVCFDLSVFLCLQASEDAKKLVNQEKSFACAEIESARAVVLRIGEALEEEEINSQASKKQVSVCWLKWHQVFSRLGQLEVNGT